MDFHVTQLNVGGLLDPLVHPQIQESIDAIVTPAGLEHYRAHGASPKAFWFGKLFPAAEISVAPV